VSEQPQLKVETSELLGRIRRYGGDETEFTRVMAAAIILASLTGRRDAFVRWLANRCEVATVTIDRWGAGADHPPSRKPAFILNEVDKYFSSTAP
jgi:hypothetical protein